MTHDTFLSLLPQYPDMMQSEEEKQAFLMHAAQCPACAAALAEHEAMLAELTMLNDDVNLPEGFTEEWQRVIEQEKTAPLPQRKPRARRGWLVAVAAVVCVFGGTALMRGGYLPSSTPVSNQEQTMKSFEPSTSAPKVARNAAPQALYASDSASMQDEYDMEEEVATEALAGGGALLPAIVLHTASIDLTSERYDADLATILDFVTQSGGWVEHQSSRGEAIADNPNAGRYAYLRLRIPVGDFDGFLDQVAAIGTLQSRETEAEDISSNYYDTKGRLAMYEAQHARLIALYDQAEDLTDIIEIENRLSEVQYTIESLSGRLNNWDRRAENALVTVYVSEVASEARTVKAPPTFGQRLSTALEDSLRAARDFAADMVVFLVMAAPYILCLGAVAAVAYILRRKRKANKKEKEQ